MSSPQSQQQPKLKLSSLSLRWAVLSMSCLAMTGVYYSFDIPAALHQQLKDYMATSSTATNNDNTYAIKFNFLYSVYSIPNIILPFFGGTIVDKLGAHYSAFIFAFLTFVGQFLFAIGTQLKSWNVMLLGRTFYGFGGESINVATSTLNSLWFGAEGGGGGELALAFGINLAVSRLGSVVNNWISPLVANSVGTTVAVWVGVLMNFLSVGAVGFIIYLTAWGEQLVRDSTSRGRSTSSSSSSSNVEDSPLTTALLSDYRQYDEIGGGGEGEGANYNHHGGLEEEVEEGHHTGNNHQSDENLTGGGDDSNLYIFEGFDDEGNNSEDNNTNNGHDGGNGIQRSLDNKGKGNENEDEYKERMEQEEPAIEHQHDGNQQETFHDDMLCQEEEQENQQPSATSSYCSCIKDLRQFDIMFWLLSASCVVVYGCVLPFNNIASGVLLERNYFKDSPEGCTLTFPNQCSSGTLAPTGGNPALDGNGNTCDIGVNVQPTLPQSIHVGNSSSSTTISTTTNNFTVCDESWDHDSYQFDNLSPDDVDCGDKFWSEACTKDYCKAQKSATETSGKIMSIPYLLSATLSPFFGHVVDKIGYRALIAMFASIMLVFVHLSLALSYSSPVIPLVGQGLAYTFYAAVIWPSVPLTVKEDLTGTAFGAITAIQNIGLALFPLLIAAIYTASDNKYIPNVEYFFIGCAVTGAIFGFMLNVYDRRMCGMLNKVQRRIVSI